MVIFKLISQTKQLVQDKNYKILNETEALVLAHVFEEIWLTYKSSQKTINLGNLYGEPSCGLISKANDWCIVGGSSIIIWAKEEVVVVKDDDLYWACNFRQKGAQKVEILVDPWSENSSIWELDIMTKEKRKLKDFPNYKGQEYSTNIEW